MLLQPEADVQSETPIRAHRLANLRPRLMPVALPEQPVSHVQSLCLVDYTFQFYNYFIK